jgi:hypothetical protein
MVHQDHLLWRLRLTGYPATVAGISGLVAYWRFANADSIRDQTADCRHGIYDGTVSLVSGLPTDSDAATYMPGTVTGTVPHDSGLLLPALTLSLWVEVPQIPEVSAAVIFSKDASGLHDGDFALWTNNVGEMVVQFQSASAQYPLVVVSDVVAGSAYHIVVTADSSGFQVWAHGGHAGTRTSFTGAWASNTNPIQFAGVAWTTDIAEIIIDEVALYDRVLTDAEIITLSQRTGPPVAASVSGLTVDEAGGVITLDVAAAGTWVGRKEDLTIALGKPRRRGERDYRILPAGNIRQRPRQFHSGLPGSSNDMPGSRMRTSACRAWPGSWSLSRSIASWARDVTW